VVKPGLSHNVKTWSKSCTARYGSQLAKRRKIERLELVDHSRILPGGLQSSETCTEPKQVRKAFCNMYLGLELREIQEAESSPDHSNPHWCIQLRLHKAEALHHLIYF